MLLLIKKFFNKAQANKAEHSSAGANSVHESQGKGEESAAADPQTTGESPRINLKFYSQNFFVHLDNCGESFLKKRERKFLIDYA